MKAYLIAALAAAPAAHAAEVARDGVSIGLHSSILEKAVTIGQDPVTTPIDRYVAGVFTRGTAFTSASVAQSPSPMIGAVALQLAIGSYTNAQTHSYTWPRPRILVDFNASGDTWANAWKTIYLTENGFSVSQTAVSASSSITFYNLDTSAWGLFWRLKSRIAYNAAYNQLMQERASQEAQMAYEVGGQLRTMVDQRTAEMLQPLQESFMEKIRGPLLVAGGLLGRTRFATETDRFSIQAGAEGVTPAVSRAEPVELRLGDQLATRVIAEKVKGRTMTGDEVFLALAGGDVPPDLADAVDLASMKKIRWAFAASDAVTLTVAEGRLTVALTFASLTRETETVNAVRVTLPAVVEREGAIDLLDLDQRLSAVATDGRTLTPEEARLATSLVRDVVPAVILELTGRDLELGSMKLALGKVEAREHELFVTLTGGSSTPGPGPGPTPSSEPRAWCEALGKPWVASGDGYHACDCGSLWIREDAITFYGEAEFRTRCK